MVRDGVVIAAAIQSIVHPGSFFLFRSLPVIYWSFIIVVEMIHLISYMYAALPSLYVHLYSTSGLCIRSTKKDIFL